MGRLAQLLPDFYATVDDMARWTPTLDALCARMSVGNAVVQLLRRDGDRLRETWSERDTLSRRHAAEHDFHVNNAENPRYSLRDIDWPPKYIILDRDRPNLHPEDLDGLRSRLAKVGLGTSICVGFPMSDQLSFSLIMHRRLDDPRDFDDEDEQALSELLPHLQQMTRLSSLLDEARARTHLLEQATNILRTGLILTDASGEVHWINSSAERMIQRSEAVRIIRGRLCGDTPASAATLRQLLATGRGSATLEGRWSGWDDALQLIVEPVDPNFSTSTQPSDGLRAIILSQPGAPVTFDPGEIARLFGLSPAEGRIASALAGGASVSSYSEERGISIATARVQLKQVLAKVSAERQSDLIRRLCNSVVAQTISPPD